VSVPPTEPVEETIANEKEQMTKQPEVTAADESKKVAQKPKSILRESSIAQKDTQRTDTVMSWIKGPTTKASVKMPPKKPEEPPKEDTDIPDPSKNSAFVEKEPKDDADDKKPPAKSVSAAMDSIETDKVTTTTTTPTAASSVASPGPASTADTSTSLTSPSATNSPGPRRAKITAAKSVLLKQARKSPVAVATKSVHITETNEKSSSATPRRKPSKQPKVQQPKEPKGSKKRKAETTSPVSPSSSSRKKSRASTTSSGKKQPAAKEIWSGVPDEIVDGADWTGWTKKTFERQSGKTKGSTDNYWYTPQEQYKLRSVKEITRFVGILKKEHGDEPKAWKKFKGK
jgi:hypothetical protein